VETRWRLTFEKLLESIFNLLGVTSVSETLALSYGSISSMRRRDVRVSIWRINRRIWSRKVVHIVANNAVLFPSWAFFKPIFAIVLALTLGYSPDKAAFAARLND
jgi:hypothetical protein